MVKFNFNLLGMLYQDGIRNLRESYQGAWEGLQRVAQKAYDELDIYDRDIKNGAAPQIEVDEHGVVFEDQRDHLIYRTTVAEEAQAALHRAFAITVFHHWEREARGWTKTAHGKFKTLRSLVEAQGYPIHPKLDDLHLLVNLLKHANADYGKELYERRPEYFEDRFDPSSGYIEWYEEVHLSDAHMAELFAIIEGSGPDVKTGIT